MGTSKAADNANSVPIWVLAQVHKSVNTSNRAALYNNTTTNAFFGNMTTSVVAIDVNKIRANGGKIAHTGIVLVNTGTGGRAGRTQTEVLVAARVTSDANSSTFKSVAITIGTQPASKSVNTGLATTFFVGATAAGATNVVTYIWQANTGSGFANLSNAGVYSNVTTATLSISVANSQVNQASYQCLVQAAGAVNVTSSAAKLTVI